jgi:hypothetical protein
MPPDPLANLCLRHSAHTFGDRILSWGGQGKWALWQFFGRQLDSSLIFGRIIYPRPGLRALSIDPFVPCLIHWYTIYLSLHIHIVLLRPQEERCRTKDDLLRDAIANLQSCFSGSENTDLRTVIAS